MSDDAHFLKSFSVEMAAAGRDYYATRCKEIAATIERLTRERDALRAALTRIATLDVTKGAAANLAQDTLNAHEQCAPDQSKGRPPCPNSPDGAHSYDIKEGTCLFCGAR